MTATERPSDLLPCPWCGEPLDSVSVSEGSTFRWRKVDGCCTDGPEVRHDTLAKDQNAAEADSKRRAIEAWNTRKVRNFRTLDAAPADPINPPETDSKLIVPSAECWRRAIAQIFGTDMADTVQRHARELAREGK